VDFVLLLVRKKDIKMKEASKMARVCMYVCLVGWRFLLCATLFFGAERNLLVIV